MSLLRPPTRTIYVKIQESQPSMSDPALQGLAYHELARVAQVRGNFTTMRTLAEQACTMARQAHQPHLLAESLNENNNLYTISPTIDARIWLLRLRSYFEHDTCLQRHWQF